MEQRKRARAIIFMKDNIVSMYREREGRIFYTFPGGGMEGNETEQQCVVREVEEEFGLIVKPIKKLYTYNGRNGIEYFYLCEYVSGNFGSGVGEEFQPDRNNGVYIPKLIKVEDIPNLPLMPPEIAKQFYQDYKTNGKTIRNKDIVVDIK